MRPGGLVLLASVSWMKSISSLKYFLNPRLDEDLEIMLNC